jgi:dipeptidase E
VRIVTVGGATADPESDRALLDALLAVVGAERPRVCFVPTASGDDPTAVAGFYRVFEGLGAACDHLPLFRRTARDLDRALAGQHLIWVGGGSTPNLLAVWAVHELPASLARAAARGAVLGGVSAGAACWAEGTVTDAFGALRPFRGGLGWLRGSLCPHWSRDGARRERYRAAVAEGELPPGIGLDDGAAALWVDGAFARAWGPGTGWRVGAREAPLA